MEVINTVLPVFLIIAVGALFRRFRFYGEDFARGLSRLVYYIALPALLFYKMAVSEFNFSQAGEAYLIVLCGMVGCVAVAYAVAAVLRLSASSTAAFVQGSFRGNLAYIGLPIVVYGSAYSDSTGVEQVSVIAALVLGMTVPVYNIVAVTVLLAGRQKLDSRAAGRVLFETMRNPLVISSVLGIVYSLTVGSLPTFADRALEALSQMALPLALLSIGASLAGPLHRNKVLPAVLSALIKVTVAPLVGVLMLMLLDMSAAERLVAMAFLACPTAVSSHIYSQQLDADEELSASIVVVTTLLSIISLSIVVAMF
jgi:predicted permease